MQRTFGNHVGSPRWGLAILTVVAMVTAACGGGADGAADEASDSASPAGIEASDSGSAEAPAELVTGPGVDAEAQTISLGEITALSGPLAVIGQPISDGKSVYFQSLNERGGIDGWTVDLTVEDSQFSPQTTAQIYDELRNDVAMISQVFGTANTAAIVDNAATDEMLLFATSQGSQLLCSDNVRIIGTPFRFKVQNILSYAHDELDVAEGSPVAIFHQEDEAGQDQIAGYERALEEFGWEDVARPTFANTDNDFTAQVQQLIDSGAELVHFTGSVAIFGPVLAKAQELGYDPIWTIDIQGFDPSLLTRAQLPAEYFDDVYITEQLAGWGEDVPGMEQMLADVERYAPEQAPNQYFTYSYVQGIVVEAVLRAALEAGDLSRAGLLAAASDLSAVDSGGLSPELSFGDTPDTRVASRASGVFQVDPDAPASITRIADNAVSELAEADEVSC